MPRTLNLSIPGASAVLVSPFWGLAKRKKGRNVGAWPAWKVAFAQFGRRKVMFEVNWRARLKCAMGFSGMSGCERERLFLNGACQGRSLPAGRKSCVMSRWVRGAGTGAERRHGAWLLVIGKGVVGMPRDGRSGRFDGGEGRLRLFVLKRQQSLDQSTVKELLGPTSRDPAPSSAEIPRLSRSCLYRAKRSGSTEEEHSRQSRWSRNRRSPTGPWDSR